LQFAALSEGGFSAQSIADYRVCNAQKAHVIEQGNQFGVFFGQFVDGLLYVNLFHRVIVFVQ
jgi:hypothetical protein